MFHDIMDALQQSRIGGNSISGIQDRLEEMGRSGIHRLYLAGFLEALTVGGALVRIDMNPAHFYFFPEAAKRFEVWKVSGEPNALSRVRSYERQMESRKHKEELDG